MTRVIYGNVRASKRELLEEGVNTYPKKRCKCRSFFNKMNDGTSWAENEYLKDDESNL